MFHPTPPKIEYTTIAGAGVSGLYFAGKLALQPHDGEISVREKEDRIGGRLYTVEVPNTGGLTAELGGMRFMESQKNVTQLVEALQLPTVKADSMSRQIFHYARNQRIELQDYKNSNIPYDLSLNEQGKSIGDLFSYTFESIVPGYMKANTLEELIPLLDGIQIDGKSLRDWDLGELARKFLSNEAYKLLHETDGFIDLFEGHNAYDKLVHNFLDSRPNKSFYRLQGGMKSLINALANKARAKNVNIFTGQQLTAVTLFDPQAEYPVFVLSFAGQNDVYARHIVLTLSPMALLTLDKNSVIFHEPKVQPLLENAKRTVTGVKVFLVYDKPWWHEKGLKDGRVHTSTASQQVYDFGSTDQGAMLCIYKDSAPNWPVTNPHDFYLNQEKLSNDIQVPKEVVQAILSELRNIFNDQHIQAPHTAFWKVWKNEQGAFFQWRPGYHSDEVMKILKNPHPNVYITGDNVNADTGWVAGAIDAADQTLQKFKL